MSLKALLQLLRETEEYQALLNRLGGKEVKQDIAVLQSAKPFLLASLRKDLAVPIVVLTARSDRARSLQEEISLWCEDIEDVLFLPEPDSLPYERSLSDSLADRERLQTLDQLVKWSRNERASGSAPIVIASGHALVQRLPAPVSYLEARHTVRVGQTIHLEKLIEKWVSMGYEPAHLVETPGTFSRRGGIVDVFPPTAELPARIELFGDEVESIRLFDPYTQRSTNLVEELTVSLPHNVTLSGQKLDVRKILDKLDFSQSTEETSQRFGMDLERLSGGEIFEGSDFYAPFLNQAALFDYLPATALWIIDEPDLLEATITDLERQAQELKETLMERGELPGNFPSPIFSLEEIDNHFGRLSRRLRLTLGSSPETDEEYSPKMPFVPAPLYAGRLRVFLGDIKALRKNGNGIVICSQQSGRLAELLIQEEIPVHLLDSSESLDVKGAVLMVHGSLSEGWSLSVSGAEPTGGRADFTGTTLFTDLEIFGFSKARRAPRKRIVPREAFVMDLTPGDYAVHVEHGIGRFVGMLRMAPDGIEREYLVLEYAAGDKLYVPTDQVDRVRRFVGSGEGVPHPTRLGTQEWLRIKEKAKKAVKELAKELLVIYSARELAEGFAFSADTMWQQELEGAFPYIETPDQIDAIVATKRDMEDTRPMDRLICGDVGYGKTEVAVRAAFKAVMDGKQVAILVPTTVLAQQHFQTFSQRMAAYPVKVEVLSRFRSEKEQKLVLEGLKDGSVDLCIGTHRLIQKDIEFKDLGLLIIDEEQRFGVAHKEKLKQMRKEVDVLTLTATPIPRTLHMSLTGIRDMSTMETPPEERLPIKTYVTGYDDRLVREVILRELDRGGQIFFVHNRVYNIESIAYRLRHLVPEARIAIGHGQMPEDQLEKVMSDFAAGKFDVLICTTIIESGLDIPNVNTIIINQADKFGLAQLYQLRGRVGRGANRAYAYFLYNKDKTITETAEKRLRTIFEATELGSGFRIAMKDLEIRGAGNLLGAEQSGHINAIGFDLYTRLLAQAVEELREGRTTGNGKQTILKAAPDEEPVVIDLPLPAFIPAEYIPDEAQRLSLYHRLSAVSSLEDIEDIAQELRDRFGDLPETVKNLLFILELRILAKKGGVGSIIGRDGEVVVKFGPKTRFGSGQANPAGFTKALTVGYGHIRVNTKQLGRKWPDALKMVLGSMTQN